MFVQFKETYPLLLLIKKIKPKKKKNATLSRDGVGTCKHCDSTASITAKGADMKRSHTSVQNICAGLSWWPLSTGFKSGVRATGTEKKEDVGRGIKG